MIGFSLSTIVLLFCLLAEIPPQKSLKVFYVILTCYYSTMALLAMFYVIPRINQAAEKLTRENAKINHLFQIIFPLFGSIFLIVSCYHFTIILMIVGILMLLVGNLVCLYFKDENFNSFIIESRSIV